MTLEFDHAVSAETVLSMVRRASEKLKLATPRVEFIEPSWNGESKETKTSWTIGLPLEKAQAQPLIDTMQDTINQSPVFRSISKIGGSVAGNTRNMAIAALAASLIGIVAYIWFRFQKVVYGLAAVVALVHDVLITVGAIAISAYLAPMFGFLMIEEFKISLPIVAALLTIIGYSLNDTIVVFDRIREVKGKNPLLTGDMINTSINQTLSRTLLTSVTTLIVVLILYAIGGDGIHGFAFALLIGVFVGTYSSIFVASPILLWLGGEKSRKAT
jgi:SecD/SecF fusion protein